MGEERHGGSSDFLLAMGVKDGDGDGDGDGDCDDNGDCDCD